MDKIQKCSHSENPLELLPPMNIWCDARKSARTSSRKVAVKHDGYI
jgi:hypothetical protein